MIRKLIYKMRKRRFCKLNRWFCPDCIYHDFVLDEYLVFRGNKCRYPKYRERSEIIKNKGGYFGTKKSEIVLKPQEYGEIWYDADKFVVVADDKRIHVIRKEYATVTVEREWPTE